MSTGSKVIARTDTQTHTQTHRDTDTTKTLPLPHTREVMTTTFVSSLNHCVRHGPMRDADNVVC